MKRNKGFIFIVTLLIITVISLLLLASMQHILLYHKAINGQEELHRNFYNLEDVARQLVQKSAPICVVGEDSPNQVLHRLLHHQGCSLANDGLQYEYLIENLGEFPCLVARIRGRMYATHHQRVSIVQFKEGRPLSFLQLRLITVGGVANCFTGEHIIPIGISSWRYLLSI